MLRLEILCSILKLGNLITKVKNQIRWPYKICIYI